MHFKINKSINCAASAVLSKGVLIFKKVLVLFVLTLITNVGFTQAFNLDQGENGGKPAKKPISAIDYPVPPTPVHWVNANLGGSNAHFMEGYSVPYRATLTGL